MGLNKVKRCIGKQNSFFGKHHSEETKRTISKKKKEYFKIHKGYWAGKKRSKETNKKISDKLKGCVSPMKGKHLTLTQRKKIGDLRRAEKSCCWKGGVTRSEGYVRILILPSYFPAKAVYRLEHRIIVERYIGRPLKKTEPIHHINGKRDDNRVINLMAFRGISAHRRYEEGKDVDSIEIIFDGRSPRRSKP